MTDKEKLRAVESQKCGTVIESDRNYTFCGQLEDVKIGSAPLAIQPQDVKTCSTTQVTENEASVCAVTVEREQHQCSVLIAPEAEVFVKIDSKLMWRLPGVAKKSRATFTWILPSLNFTQELGLFHREI